MAGLPANVSALISNKNVSFLCRSRQHYLGRISDSEISRAFRKTVESAGKEIDESAMHIAIKTAAGFPYMMQLAGYSMWEESGEEALISEKYAKAGVALAIEDFQVGVLSRTWRELSGGDRKFLLAMLEDSEYSRLADIAKRLGKTTGYVSTYKKRLLQAGVIEEQPGQTISFSMPFLREYIERI